MKRKLQKKKRNPKKTKKVFYFYYLLGKKEENAIVEDKSEKKEKKDKKDKKEKKDKKDKKEKKSKKDKEVEETPKEEEIVETPKADETPKEEVEEDNDFVVKKPEISGNFRISAPGMKPTYNTGGRKDFNKQPDGPVDENSTEVYVNGYPYETKEEDVRELFKDCGEIVNITLPMFDDNPDRCKGFGFIEFKTADAVTKALELTGTPMGKRTISVQRKLARAGKAPRNAPARPVGACPDGCNTLFCGNLSFDINDDSLKDFFKGFEIQAIRYGEDRQTGQFKGFAFVEFPDSEQTGKAAQLNGQKLLGRPIRLDYSLPKK